MLTIKAIGILIALVIAVYLIVLVTVAANERRFIYFPDKRRFDPATLSVARINEQVIDTPDGEHLVCWYLEAAPGQPTVLYFHGNGGDLQDRIPRFGRFNQAGVGLFMMSYRSYSGSTGTPTEANNIADARLAWDALTAKGIAGEDIVLYGESLGTGIAIQLAVDHKPRALVLEAPYSSIVDIAKWRTPFLPVGHLMKDRYESVLHIRKVTLPLLVIHGERDGIVPIRFGRKLFAAANEPKRFMAYPKAGHNDLYDRGAFDAVLSFVGGATAGS